MTHRPRLRLTVPPPVAGDTEDRMRSLMIRLVASGSADTRTDLVKATGYARSTVNGQIDAMMRAGTLVESGTVDRPGRGRPAHRLALAGGAGLVLVADVGVHSTRFIVADVNQNLLAESHVEFDLGDGPEPTLDAVTRHLRDLLAGTGAAADAVRAVTIGLPAPVDAQTGTPVRPPIMPGWDGFPVGQIIAERFSCDVVVDNDVNLMALGEARARSADAAPLLFIKVGTGIGGGLVLADGQLHRGSDGSAGDIGHIRVPGADDVVCQCGNVGCVEAVASAAAVMRDLHPEFPELAGVRDLAAMMRDGEPLALRRIREAAETIGEVVAILLHFYNPRTVALGGLIAASSDEVLAGIRSVVYRRALPLATRNLVLGHSELGRNAGVAGGLVAGIEQALSPSGIAEMNRRTTRVGRST